MNANIARYIALPIVSAGILGGAALGLAGMANASTTVNQNGPNVSIVTSPTPSPSPRRPRSRVGTTTTASAAWRCSTSKSQPNRPPSI